jgi:hypothetical protein
MEYWEPTFFADDTNNFTTGNSTNEMQKKTNVTINDVTEWFERNRLTINTEKPIVIAFHHPQKLKLQYHPIKDL